jgi:aerobic carbon-monoxide dehydrogenase small subunit
VFQPCRAGGFRISGAEVDHDVDTTADEALIEGQATLVPVTLEVNGHTYRLDVEPRTLLVHLLRYECELTGTKIGCDTSQCGACTVLIDGRAAKSCTVLAIQADGREVTTIEGVGEETELHPLQQAFAAHHGFQCGFCTPGMIMASLDLLGRDPDPDEHAIRHALEGNLCRCTGYQSIVESVRAAAQTGVSTT